MVAKPELASPMKRQSSFEKTSDKTAAAFVRRVLVSPHLSTTNTSQPAELEPSNTRAIDTSLPPLTSINEVDLQLYALIAILVKDCIHSWYSRFSSDQAFVDDLLQVITHCTRALEERLRHMDLEQLLLDEIPAIIEAHITTFRQSQKLAIAHNSTKDIGDFYSIFRPHPALLPVPNNKAATAEQACNDSLYRQLLADGMLALLLPYDDLRNPCLRSLTAEVLGDMILGGFVGGKLCDGVFVYDMITRIAQSSASHRKPWAIDPCQQPTIKANRLERLGLLTSSITTTKESSTKKYDMSEAISMVLQYCLLFLNVVQTFFSRVMSTTTLPLRAPTRDYRTTNTHPRDHPDYSGIADNPISISVPTTPSFPRPIIAYRLWSLASSLLSIQTRMPWLSGTLALLQHKLLNGPGRLGSTNSHLDLILAQYLLAPIFPVSKHLPSILSNLRTALFPNNTVLQSGSSGDFTPDVKPTKAQSRRAAAVALLNLVPPAIAKLYFAQSVPPTPAQSYEPGSEKVDQIQIEPMIQVIEEDILASFGEDSYLTRHLMYSIVDCLVAKIFPELQSNGVAAALAGKEIVPP